MIFECRRYTLAPGRMGDFIALQHRRGFDGPNAGFISRAIGYFETVTGTPEQIVHLYRYDSYEDWIEKLHGLYAIPGLAFYFTEARALVERQETGFFPARPARRSVPAMARRDRLAARAGKGALGSRRDARPRGRGDA